MNSSSFYMIVIAVAALVLLRRVRAMYRPVKGSGIRLLLPIAYLLLISIPVTLNPEVHAVGWEWCSAFVFGILLSAPLIWTTNYERRSDQQIYAKKNWSFIAAFLIVFAIRFLLREYLKSIGPETEMALFLIVALGYVLPWRISSFLKYRSLRRS